MKLITISKSDPAFKDYLLGTFSAEERALPVESYNISWNKPSVTFQVVGRKECLQNTSKLRAVLSLIRPESLVFTTGALLMMTALIPSVRSTVLAHWNVWLLILCSISFLHAGANALNDFNDHLKGVDIVQNRTGSRVIQRGWLTALQVQRYAWVMLSVGTILGLCVLVMKDFAFAWIAGLAALGLLSYSSQKGGLKYHGGAELALFLICGPLLTAGFETFMTGEISLVGVLFGVWNGLAAAQLIFVRNWFNMQFDETVGSRTLAVRLKFDRCKQIFWISLMARVVTLAWLALVLHSMTARLLFILELYEVVVIFGLQRKIRSIVSSDLADLRPRLIKFSIQSLMVLVAFAFIEQFFP